ncbi:DUF5050 domain-containing protein [Hathewaya histolytica]|uniref:DUF5050 domain-containing protein n=1 Tax=Hathewaya histolytica TaxID=1498 RepID=UPI0010FDD946
MIIIYSIKKYSNEIIRCNLDGASQKVIYKALTGIYSLNCDGKHLYYSVDNQSTDEEKNYGIYKLDMNGNARMKLTNKMCRYFNISSKWIHFDSDNKNLKIKK